MSETLLYSLTFVSYIVIHRFRGYVMLLKQLKQNFLIINATVYFDEQQYLREQTNNPARVQVFIQQAEVLLQQIDNEEEQYYLLGSLGYCYRILNQANKAIFYLEQCLKKVEANPARNMVTLIRLGRHINITISIRKH